MLSPLGGPDSPPLPGPLPLVSSEEVMARLAEVASAVADVPGSAPGALIVFDADGTLWTGDIGVDTFEALLDERGVRPEALAALRREAESHGVQTTDDPTNAARALYVALERGTYPEGRAFQMMAWAFAGYRETETRAFALDVIEKVALATRLHPEVLPIVRWAAGRSIPLFVVSASPTIVVRAAIERLGLPVAEVFGMSVAVDGGVLAPRLVGPATYGTGKVDALRQATGGSPTLGAFGDSVYDLPMLSEARISVAVRPKPELRARAGACPGLVELAPRSP
jgi:phosphatidylglycerophosphatase C